MLEKHWTGARGKGMKGALTLFAQDAESKLLLYTAADIRRAEVEAPLVVHGELGRDEAGATRSSGH